MILAPRAASRAATRHTIINVPRRDALFYYLRDRAFAPRADGFWRTVTTDGGRRVSRNKHSRIRIFSSVPRRSGNDPRTRDAILFPPIYFQSVDATTASDISDRERYRVTRPRGRCSPIRRYSPAGRYP